MQIFPLGFILIAIFFLARIKGPQTGFMAAMAIVPLGALAFLNSGNFSLIAYHGAFVLMLGFAVARHLMSPTRHQLPRMELAGIVLMILVVYALITSQLMPRLFAGDIWVFSLQSGIVGQRVSPYFYSTVTLLSPSSGNISQPVYFVLSALVFLLALRMSRKFGTGFLDKSIYLAAAVIRHTFCLYDDALFGYRETAGSRTGRIKLIVGCLGVVIDRFCSSSICGDIYRLAFWQTQYLASC